MRKRKTSRTKIEFLLTMFTVMISVFIVIWIGFNEFMNQKPPEPKIVFLPQENTNTMNGIDIGEIKAIAERWLRYHGQ